MIIYRATAGLAHRCIRSSIRGNARYSSSSLMSSSKISDDSTLLCQQQTLRVLPSAITTTTTTTAARMRSFSSVNGGGGGGDGQDAVVAQEPLELESLPAILNRELAEEKRLGGSSTTTTDALAMPAHLREVMNMAAIDTEWRLVDTPGEAVVRLYKKETLANGAKVMVRFHCQDTLPPDLNLLERGLDAMRSGNDDEDEDDEEEEEEDAQALRFDVVLTRAGKSLLVRCLSEEAQAVLEGMVVRNEGEEESSSSSSSSNVSNDNNSDHYEGPDFTDLPEDLQRSLTSLVQDDCGVTEHVAVFLAMYADYKEQSEYVRWMEGVKSLVE